MVPPATESAPGPDPRLDDRVMELLSAHAGRLAFNGLRRTLGAHPESLARALRRLERDGLIDRSDHGYALRSELAPPVRAGPRAVGAARPVGSIVLPAGVGTPEVLGALAGRWFGPLRWVGIYENPGDPWLVWSVGDSGGHVFLHVNRRTLRILVDRRSGAPGAADVEDAAHELVVQGLTRLRRMDRGTAPPVAFFARATPSFPGAN